jgi:predicted Fe-Mo cluster-binding NifX family protein
MKIAIPTDDGATISPHFGRSAAFLVYEVEHGKITSRETRTNAMHHPHGDGDCSPGGGGHVPHSHGGILSSVEGCSVVICAGMGWRAADALKAAGVAEILNTVPGPAELAVAAYLSGVLPVSGQDFCRCSH